MTEDHEIIVAKILQFAEENEAMPITQALSIANSEDCDVYKGAVVLGGENGGPFEVQFDYSPGNVTYWSTHEEARAEAARLWLSCEASHIDDFVVRAVGERISTRVREYDERLAAYAAELKAEIRSRAAA
ncbi:hypothetical protein ABVB70_11960 [Agrobacterium radiobacter]|uniref:Uncharacterized protein n=1 Tax=Agrobacterium radiobacter TaxID=362 RepID=A0ABD5LKR3_AGRRD